MVFSGIPFLFYFLPIFLILYYASPDKLKNLVLLIFSLIFYAWGEPKYIVLLVISSVVDYANGRFLEKFDDKAKLRRVFLVISVTVNLGLLAVFKYASLFINNAPALPLGISFFTFQTMSYSIDVYRRKVKAEHNFIDYMTYVSMFPQLVAGPIVRYEDISVELKKRSQSFDDFTEGMNRFLMGLFKKVLIANQLGSLWDIVLESPERSVLYAWLGLAAFSLQIYFDFSGYSDMAIGLGRMMGFNYPENFNYPYIAKSVSEFWRRWHMSLTTWFKDYVYIPLGGNRRGMPRTLLNIFIVWALTGFWHGASWNFLAWGAYFGMIIIMEKLFMAKVLEIIPGIICHIYTLLLVIIGWMIFAVENFSKIGQYSKQIFGLAGQGLVGNEFLYQLRNYAVILLVGVIFSMPVMKKIKGTFFAHKAEAASARTAGANVEMDNKRAVLINIISVIGVICMLILTVFTIACLVADTYNPFLYFRF